MTEKVTGQTGQGDREPYWEMAEDEDGQWHWCLWSGNARMMAQSAASYNDATSCRAAIQHVTRLASEAKRIRAANDGRNGKRGRGRPKGSKNKFKDDGRTVDGSVADEQREMEEAEAQAIVRRAGYPTERGEVRTPIG